MPKIRVKKSRGDEATKLFGREYVSGVKDVLFFKAVTAERLEGNKDGDDD